MLINLRQKEKLIIQSKDKTFEVSIDEDKIITREI